MSPTPPLGGWDHQLVLNLLMIFKQVGIYDLSCNESLVIYDLSCNDFLVLVHLCIQVSSLNFMPL